MNAKIYRMRINRRVGRDSTTRYWDIAIKGFFKEDWLSFSNQMTLLSTDEINKTKFEDIKLSPPSSRADIKFLSYLKKFLFQLGRHFEHNLYTDYSFVDLSDNEWFEEFEEEYDSDIYELEKLICETFMINGFAYNKHKTFLNYSNSVEDEYEYIFHKVP